MKNIKLPEVKQDYIPFNGGLDLVSGTWNANPGTLRQCQNFEIDINGGYQDIKGYERFDGQAKPSAAIYHLLPLTSVSGSIAVGNTVEGDTSGATAVVLQVNTLELVVTKVTGTFVAAEDLLISAVPVAVVDSASLPNGESDSQISAQYTALAADNYRADIGAIPGSGKVLGLFRISDVIYGWRNNAGGTAAVLHKSSGAGWVAVSLGYELDFTSGGTTEIVEGNTITGAISGATGTVGRVIVTSGTWAGGDAAGRFILTAQTGTFQAENLDVGASLNLATIAGDSTAITHQPSGDYEHITHNFANGDRIYGADGVNRGFEFDGTVFVPIDTGMTTDTPSHVAAHKSHLFFSFINNVQHSSIGDPYTWSVVLGAGAINADQLITGFKKEPGYEGGGALGVYCRNVIHILYGSSSSDWNLVSYREEVGAYAGTVQQLSMTVFLDDQGITSLQTSQSYGNFQHATFSRQIQPLINEKRSLAVSSCISRDKSQYRLFFSDGSVIYVTLFGTKVLGITPILFNDVAWKVISGESSSGTEEIFFGSDDGYVYQMERGTSFDGDDIEAYMYIHYNYAKALKINKGYKGVTFEASGNGYAQFNFSYELNYNSTENAQPDPEAVELPFSSVLWDSFVWDAFVWDSQTTSPTYLKLEGNAENISLVIRKQSDYMSPVRFIGALVDFTLRRLVRGS